MNKKTVGRISAMAMASMMMMSVCVVNASAEENEPITQLNLKKTVTTDGNTYQPNTSFSFHVENGEAAENWRDNVVYAGVTGGIKATQTIGFQPSGEDTLAATFEDQIDEEVKEERRDELMSLQQEISYEHTQQLVGKTIKVMVEGYLFEDDIYVGRSYMDAPKVDGCVFINSPEELMTGDFVYVKITQGREYDVIGEVDYEFTK